MGKGEILGGFLGILRGLGLDFELCGRIELSDFRCGWGLELRFFLIIEV